MEVRNIQKLFFENIGIKQTILKNTFWLSFSEVITGFLRLILLIFVARILGAQEYGKLTFAFSFVSMMVIFSDLGIVDIATREFSRGKEKEKDFSRFLTLEIILDIGALILMFVGSFFITPNPIIRKTIWILAIFILISSCISIFLSLLRSRQKMEYEAGIKIVQALLMTGIAFFVLFQAPSVLNLSYGYLFSNIIIFIIFLAFFHFYFHPVKLKWDKNIFNILKISWPLSFGFSAGWICININSIMLGYFNLLVENGWYNAASRVIYGIFIVACLIIRSFYPALSNFFISSREKLQKSWNYLMRSMIFLTIPMTIGGITLAPKIIYFLYGSNFVPSIPAFQLLILALGIFFISFPYSIMLIVADFQKKNFTLIAAGIAINIILNILLIPLCGLYGAIVSTIISSAVILISTIIAVKYLINIPLLEVKLFKDIIIAGFSGLAMFFIIIFPTVYNLSIIFSVALGAITYFLALFLFYKIYAVIKNIPAA